jgi:hypothetical protein
MPFAQDPVGSDIAVQASVTASRAQRFLLRMPTERVATGSSDTIAQADQPQAHNPESLSQAAERMVEHLGCDVAGIRLVAEDSHATYRAYAGRPSRFCNRRDCRAGNGVDCICTRVLRSDGQHRFPSLTASGTFVVGTAAERERVENHYKHTAPALLGANGDYQSLILVRIRSEERSLGLIHCAAAPPHWFTPERVAWLEATADEIGEKLFYDSLWRPVHRIHHGEFADATACCPICGRRRDESGLWVTNQHAAARLPWAVIQVPRIVCPHCLRFCNSE